MVKSKFETNRQTILYFWRSGIHSTKEIHKMTNYNISLRTIENNLCKLKQCNSIERKKGSVGRNLAKVQNAIILFY